MCQTLPDCLVTVKCLDVCAEMKNHVCAGADAHESFRNGHVFSHLNRKYSLSYLEMQVRRYLAFLSCICDDFIVGEIRARSKPASVFCRDTFLWNNAGHLAVLYDDSAAVQLTADRDRCPHHNCQVLS